MKRIFIIPCFIFIVSIVLTCPVDASENDKPQITDEAALKSCY
jgi:hypothetical protein